MKSICVCILLSWEKEQQQQKETRKVWGNRAKRAGVCSGKEQEREREDDDMATQNTKLKAEGQAQRWVRVEEGGDEGTDL